MIRVLVVIAITLDIIGAFLYFTFPNDGAGAIMLILGSLLAFVAMIEYYLKD